MLVVPAMNTLGTSAARLLAVVALVDRRRLVALPGAPAAGASRWAPRTPPRSRRACR